MTTFLFSVAAAAFGLTAPTAPVKPDDPAIHRFVRVGDLRVLCDGNHSEMCSGYVMAVVDTANSIRVAELKPEVVCPPNGAGNEQLDAVIRQGLKADKSPDDFGAPTAILGWLSREFPCR